MVAMSYLCTSRHQPVSPLHSEVNDQLVEVWPVTGPHCAEGSRDIWVDVDHREQLV